MREETLWIIMAVIFSPKGGLILCLSCAQIIQRFMKDLNTGGCFKPFCNRELRLYKHWTK